MPLKLISAICAMKMKTSFIHSTQSHEVWKKFQLQFYFLYELYIIFKKYPNSDHSVLVLHKLVLQSCDGREQNQNYVTRLGITEALITIIGRSKSFQVQESCTETHTGGSDILTLESEWIDKPQL